MGTEKNRLIETVFLSTQNVCLHLWVQKYLQLYAKNCLSKPVKNYKNPSSLTRQNILEIKTILSKQFICYKLKSKKKIFLLLFTLYQGLRQ